MHIQHRARIQVAAACAHGQAIERGHAHGGVEAFTPTHGTQASPVAQMRRHHAAFGQGGVVAVQAVGDPFIRKPVEAIAAHALRAYGRWQRIATMQGILRSVERRVEAAILREVWLLLPQCLHRMQVMRLVQRCQRAKAAQVCHRFRVEADGGAVTLAPMHDTVGGGFQRPVMWVGVKPVEHMGQCFGMGGVGGQGGDLIARVFGCMHLKHGCTAEICHLAAEQERQGFRQAEEAELNAGGTGIQREQGVHYATLPFCRACAR